MARLVYLGSPSAAVAPLRSLVAAGHDVALVISRPDTRRGRGSEVTPSPVKAAAVDLGLSVADGLDALAGVDSELGVVVAYGRIVPASVLDALAMVNLHFSLLPRWRGAAPVERAVLAGDTDTGVCLMRLEAGLDTGPVLLRRAVSIGPDEHAGALTDRLSALGAKLLCSALAGGVGGLGPGEPQRGEPIYAAKLEVGDLALHWDRSAEELHRVVRLDRAWTTFRDRRLRVLDAGVDAAAHLGPPGTVSDAAVSTGSGALVLRVVQPEGKRPMDAAAWWRGVRPKPGERLFTPDTDR
ncbi:MAG TPA: methionyl-tRNA formyltransferase [Acidimicrobiales bacterium]|nr:methionyl-tRNA formyltransferase [Acidimicrobiales bacterium]